MVTEKIKSWIFGDDPDAGDLQKELESNTADTSQGSFDQFEDVSGEEIANALRKMNHEERVELIKKDEFIENHWERTREAIRNDEELLKEFGVDEKNIVTDPNGGGIKTCDHHKNAPVESDTVEPTQSRTLEQSKTTHEEVGGEVDVQAARTDGRAGNQEGAKAAKTTTEERASMSYCSRSPDDCKTSLNGAFRAAEGRYEKMSNDPVSQQLLDYVESSPEPTSNNPEADSNIEEAERTSTSPDEAEHSSEVEKEIEDPTPDSTPSSSTGTDGPSPR